MTTGHMREQSLRTAGSMYCHRNFEHIRNHVKWPNFKFEKSNTFKGISKKFANGLSQQNG